MYTDKSLEILREAWVPDIFRRKFEHGHDTDPSYTTTPNIAHFGLPGFFSSRGKAAICDIR